MLWQMSRPFPWLGRACARSQKAILEAGIDHFGSSLLAVTLLLMLSLYEVSRFCASRMVLGAVLR